MRFGLLFDTGCPRIESRLCPGDRRAPPGSPANTGGSPWRCVAASHPKLLSTREKKQGGPNSDMSIAKKRHSPTPFEKNSSKAQSCQDTEAPKCLLGMEMFSIVPILEDGVQPRQAPWIPVHPCSHPTPTRHQLKQLQPQHTTSSASPCSCFFFLPHKNDSGTNVQTQEWASVHIHPFRPTP